MKWTLQKPETLTGDEADTTLGQGGAGLNETSGNTGRPGEDANNRSVQQVFNLDLEQQTETLIRYQQHLAQVVDQNKQTVEMIEKINVECQGLTTQVETALQQNADLIKNFKGNTECGNNHHSS